MGASTVPSGETQAVSQERADPGDPRVDPAEFRAMYEALASVVTRRLTHATGDPHLARDLAQDTFVVGDRNAGRPLLRTHALVLLRSSVIIIAVIATAAAMLTRNPSGWLTGPNVAFQRGIGPTFTTWEEAEHKRRPQ